MLKSLRIRIIEFHHTISEQDMELKATITRFGLTRNDSIHILKCNL